MHTERIFNESVELPGCIVGAEYINNLRYADDAALLVESENAIVDVVRQNSEENGLSMNVKKTKTMVVCRDGTSHVRIVVSKWACLRTSKGVEISGSMGYRRW